MKKKIAITLDEEVLIKLKEYANKEDRTVSSQINKILKDYFLERMSKIILFCFSISLCSFICYSSSCILILILSRFEVL